MFLDKIKTNWDYVNRKLSGTNDYWYLTPINYSMYKIITKHLKGSKYNKVLDIGAGNLAFKTLINECAEKYISLDLKMTNDNLDIIASGTNLPIKDNYFDIVICSAVLEHTPEPWKIINEIYRVLNSSGELILTVPHIQHIHGEPEDYWRFTKYGITKLIDLSDFKYSKLEILEVGYFINFCISLLIPMLFGTIMKIKVLEAIMVIILKCISRTFEKIDKMVSFNKLALGYIGIVRK
jgi:ubiquinone/menaquinone biosynthesis C-methylase UbiE